MNSNSNSGGNGISRRTVLRLAGGAGFTLAAGAVSGGRLVNTAIAQAGDTELVCTEDGVRIRKAPGLSGTIIGYLRQGVVVNLIGDPVSRDGYTWLNISPQADRTKTGWAAAQFFMGNEAGFPIGTDVTTTFGGRPTSTLAKVLGAWPSVLTVAAVTAAAAYRLADRRAAAREARV